MRKGGGGTHDAGYPSGKNLKPVNGKSIDVAPEHGNHYGTNFRLLPAASTQAHVAHTAPMPPPKGYPSQIAYHDLVLRPGMSRRPTGMSQSLNRRTLPYKKPPGR